MTTGRYGEGSVHQRGDNGLWVADYQADGKRRSAYGKTRRQAIDKRRDALARLANGLPATEARPTFSQLSQQWKDAFSRTLNMTEASRKNYIDVLRLHVEPVIGTMRISTIRPSDVALVLTTMDDKNYSPSYRHQAHKAISHVFKMAIADGLIRDNPTRSVAAPRGNAKPTFFPDREDVRAMIEAAPDPRTKTFLVIVAHTGVRISEALSLKWSDVNEETKSITVLGKGNKLRAVYLTPTLASQLRAWRRAQAKERLAASWWSAEGDWIITTDIGTQMDAHNWRKKHFNPLRDKVCPRATPHSLRRGFATIMLEEGVPMKVVSTQLGHSSTRITEEVYSHVTARLQSEAGAAIERVLGG